MSEKWVVQYIANGGRCLPSWFDNEKDARKDYYRRILWLNRTKSSNTVVMEKAVTVATYARDMEGVKDV